MIRIGFWGYSMCCIYYNKDPPKKKTRWVINCRPLFYLERRGPIFVLRGYQPPNQLWQDTCFVALLWWTIFDKSLRGTANGTVGRGTHTLPIGP